MDNFRQKITRKQTGLHADELSPCALSVQEGNCCTAEGSYRDGAATEGMALTKPVAPFLVSITWSSMETHTLKQKFIMLVRKKNQLWYWFHGIWKLNSFPFPAYKAGASPSLQGTCTFLPPLSPWNLFYSKAPTSVTPKIAWYKSKLEQSIAQFWRCLFVFFWKKHLCTLNLHIFSTSSVSEKHKLCQQSSSCLI